MAGVNPLGGSLPEVGEGAGANAGASGSSMLSCGLMGSPFREADSHRFGGLGNDARPGAPGSLAAAAVLKWSRIVASFRGCAGEPTGDCGWESLSETGNNGASVGGYWHWCACQLSDGGPIVWRQPESGPTRLTAQTRVCIPGYSTEGPISGSAGTWRSDVSTVAGGVETLAGCRVSAQGLALT